MDDHLLQHLTPAALARNELFQGLSTDELERLSQRLRFRRAKKGAVLCKEGDPSDSMYIIEAGQIRVYKETPDGRILLATAGPGSHVGEMALLTGDARSATLVVSIDAELWELTKGDFDEVLREYPGIPLTFSRVLAKRLSQADRRIVLEETSHLVALVGTPQEAVRLAESVYRQSGRTVLLLDLVETGDECSTIDPADPFHDVIGIAEGVSRVDVPVFLIQPPKDVSLGPSRDLGAEFRRLGRDYRGKVYPDTIPAEMQSHCFGGGQGNSVWAADVLSFVDSVLVRRRP